MEDKKDTYMTMWWKEHPEKRKEYNKRYYQKHRQKVRELQKVYFQTKKGKEAQRRANKNRDPKKVEARYRVYDEKRHKRLNQESCSVCGNLKTEAHHEDYNKPLEVLWLCLPHHLEKHDKQSAFAT